MSGISRLRGIAFDWILYLIGDLWIELCGFIGLNACLITRPQEGSTKLTTETQDNNTFKYVYHIQNTKKLHHNLHGAWLA